MKKIEYFFSSACKTTEIRVVKYVPNGDVKAILQISHGMIEFIDRYEDFAKYLNSKGILVVGNDHLGHGGSVNNVDEWGYFAKENGNEVLIEDLYTLTKLTKQEYPDIPYFMLGHSMGSFYARQYIAKYGNELNGCIVMGTGNEPAIKVKFAMLLCRIIALFKGWKYRSTFINDMAFGAYNKMFEPNRTRVDWLSKDESIVDKYINEPRCNFMFTLNGYYNMFKGIARLSDKEVLGSVPKNLPVFFVSGQDDPVGSCGKEVQLAYNNLCKAGVQDVLMKLYPNDRHEILNELDKQTVYTDLYEWLMSKIK